MSEYLREFGRTIPEDVRHSCETDGDYALSFDDGPSQNFVDILNILDRFEVKATFFIVGANLEKEENRELIRKAHQSGHQISNHTFSHVDLTMLNKEDIRSEVGKTRARIIEILGESKDVIENASLVRPPFGYVNDFVHNVIKDAGYTTVRWNADRYDWKLQAPQYGEVLARVRQQLEFIEDTKMDDPQFNTSIIDLNHDHSDATLAALGDMIASIRSRAYRFVTLHECLNGPD